MRVTTVVLLLLLSVGPGVGPRVGPSAALAAQAPSSAPLPPGAAKSADETINGKRRVVYYDAKGGVVQVSEPLAEKELPSKVAAAMHSHPRAIFVSGVRVTRDNKVEYHLVVKGTRKSAMVVAPDGTEVSFR
jgi:hypothetical protein